jgi:hypothetical protein
MHLKKMSLILIVFFLFNVKSAECAVLNSEAANTGKEFILSYILTESDEVVLTFKDSSGSIIDEVSIKEGMFGAKPGINMHIIKPAATKSMMAAGMTTKMFAIDSFTISTGSGSSSTGSVKTGNPSLYE